MKCLLALGILATASGEAYAQVGMPVFTQDYIAKKAEIADLQWRDLVPDYGYVVYDANGEAIKAFGPGTPVDFLPDGSLRVLGTDLPAGSVLTTEDGPAFLSALGTIAEKSPTADSDYSKKMRELVGSISDGAAYVAESLCPHPARPSTITVEMEGGFSFGVHGSIKSTVDWNLDEICPASDAAALSSPAQ